MKDGKYVYVGDKAGAKEVATGLDYYVKQLRCLNENQNENSKSAKPQDE